MSIPIKNAKEIDKMREVCRIAGHILERTHSYSILFVLASSAYLLALLIMRLLAPGLKKVEFSE